MQECWNETNQQKHWARCHFLGMLCQKNASRGDLPKFLLIALTFKASFNKKLCVFVWVCARECEGPWRSEEGVWPPELELLAVLSHSALGLHYVPLSSPRAGCVLPTKPPPQALLTRFDWFLFSVLGTGRRVSRTSHKCFTNEPHLKPQTSFHLRPSELALRCLSE